MIDKALTPLTTEALYHLLRAWNAQPGVDVALVEALDNSGWVVKPVDPDYPAGPDPLTIGELADLLGARHVSAFENRTPMPYTRREALERILPILNYDLVPQIAEPIPTHYCD